MRLPTEHIIEKIRQNAEEIDQYRQESVKVEIWWNPETGVSEPIISSVLAPISRSDSIKEIAVGDAEDVEKLVTERFQSSHSPQERELEEEEEREKKQTDYRDWEVPPTKKQKDTPSPVGEKLKFNIAQLLSLSHQQLCVFLCKTGKLSNRDTAKLMGIDESTVREHWKSVKKRLNTPSL